MKTGSISKRKAERANISDRIKGVFLKCPTLSENDIRIANISTGGIGINANNVTTKINEKTIVDAKILVGWAVVPLQMQLVHKSKTTYGFKFLNANDTFISMIQAAFEPELAGASLKKTNTKLCESNKLLSIIEYSDSKKNTIIIHTENGLLKYFKISFFGDTVEWTHGKFLAELYENEPKPAGFFLRSKLQKYIKNAEAIRENIREQIGLILQDIPLE